jgi:hypothetical protein
MPPGTERELERRYHIALRKYYEANASSKGLTGPELDEANRRAEESRAEFDQARQELVEFRVKTQAAAGA